MPEELYRSANIVVRRSAVTSVDRCVVTFDHHNTTVGLDRPGFGEDFLRASNIPAIHVLGRGNDWYQYDDIFEALAVIRTATESVARKITYGSSMGGYAALRCANAIGADGILALSPQWSINPDHAKWENRWTQDAHRIRWMKALDGALRCSVRPVLVYDPTLPLDRRHATLIAENTPSTLIAVPYGGHPAGTFLGETGLLPLLLENVLHDCLDHSSFVAEIKKRRSRSSVYLGTLAERQPNVRPRTAIALARHACAVRPGETLGMLSLARVLTRAGEHGEAIALHREIVALAQRLSIYLVPFAEALIAAGEHSEGISVSKEVVDASPDVAHLRNWRSVMLWKQGKQLEAIEEQTRATTLDPNNRRYRRRLRIYRVTNWGQNVLSALRIRGAYETNVGTARSGSG